MKTTEKASIRKALKIFFENKKSGERFTPPLLKAEVCGIVSGYEFKYLDTFMRIARMYFRARYRCIDRANSIYEIN